MKTKGFTTLEMLVSLGCVCMLLPILYLSLRQFQLLRMDEEKILEREIAMGQLRLSLALYDIETVEEEELILSRGNKEFKVSIVNEKLVLSPGTQIVLADVPSIRFLTLKGGIYVQFEDEKRYWIAPIERFY